MSRIKSISGNYVYNITSFASSLLDDVDAPSAQNTLGLVPGTNVQTYDAATVKSNITQAHTKQQYAVPVVHATTTGPITLDADIHQDVIIIASGAITLPAPLHPATGKTIFLTLYAASALGITWDSIFKGNADFPTLDATFVTGKAIYLQFRYNGSNWVLMGRAQEV